jgi:hypothetical protein
MVWMGASLLLRRWKPARTLLMAGAISVVLVLPYLRSLSGPGSGGSFVHFEVRPFVPLLNAMSGRPVSAVSAAILRLAVLPLNYFLELGFFGVAAGVYLYGLRGRGKAPPHVVAAIVMASVSVFICTFLRSGVISANDLGCRGFLPAQFIMLLWAADLMERRSEQAERSGKGRQGWWLRSPLWAPLILLGVAGTMYEFVLSRTFFVWVDHGLIPTNYFAPAGAGERALELRRAFEILDRILPRDAKLQSSPEWRYFDFYTTLYSGRQTAVADHDCGTVFGGDAANCPAAYADVSAIFQGSPNETWQNVQAVCRRFSIDALVVTDLDGAWRSGWSVESQVEPAVSGNHVRVYLPGDPHK